MDFQEFRSGSDIRGVAIETQNSSINLTDDVIKKIVYGFYAWLNKRFFKNEYVIAVGHDSRLSAERIKCCVINTLSDCGAKVLDCGLVSTPAMFMITVDDEYSADASIQITASHHPFDKNGLKFFTPSGGLDSEDIQEILQYAQEGMIFSKKEGSCKKVNFIDKYADKLVQFVQNKVGNKKPLSGCKIIVDAGNGAGGFYASKVLKKLGANTDGSQFLEPDGNFPNHIPNPENPDAMSAICKQVIATKADFGIIFDTDVDRAGAVDRHGNEINRNKLIALISDILLKEKNPAVIVTDSVTSDGLKQFIEKRNGKHLRFKRGYKNVINECIRLNKEGVYSPLAIETSGHAAFLENYYLDDGAYLVTRILAKLGQLKKHGGHLEDLISDYKAPKEQAEIRLGFQISDYSNYGANILRDIDEFAKQDDKMILNTDSFEGVRINFPENYGDGFCLLRMSVHDPIMPVNIESNSIGGVKTIAKKLYDFLKNYSQIDISNLEKIL